MGHTRPHSDGPSLNHRPQLDTDLSGPLRIAEVPIPVPGSLGITHCPGRNGIDSAGYRWKRNLRDDLRDHRGMGRQRRSDTGRRLRIRLSRRTRIRDRDSQARLFWYHMAIPDIVGAGNSVRRSLGARWSPNLRISSRWRRLAVHCAGGLGRSGMIAAKLVIALGAPASHAVAAVRQARPGAIETDEQLDYILNGPSLEATAARR